jgi:hypothetical protein
MMKVCRFFFTVVLWMVVCFAGAQDMKSVTRDVLVGVPRQYSKVEIDIGLAVPFNDPYDAEDIAVDVIFISPAGKTLTLPCYYIAGDRGASQWRARFTPQEAGTYRYHVVAVRAEKSVAVGRERSFQATASPGKDGFLHAHDYWTFRFDSGKLFRGIGENVGWESRSFEDDKWTYDYLLPTLSSNGANFFRTWMHTWNLPVAWPNVHNTKRYTDARGRYNESGSKRMDELVQLCDSLGLYFMVSIDAHGSLIKDGEWNLNSHNVTQGGPANSPEEFFSLPASRKQYKNRLRYIVARWGYSPSIGAWEFFNEIDNAVFTRTPHDSVLIAHKYITAWHDEMSQYLQKLDPYDHLVTTSISHRDIEGMNDLKGLDFNQKHIYNKTHLIAPEILTYTARHRKPFVVGEFGYDWDWDNVKHEAGAGFDFDYRRGLWYGMFSPTPILPMTWWWEFFDERGMTKYFKGVREISDKMLAAGKGKFEQVRVSAKGVEVFGVKCGETCFVYVLNGGDGEVSAEVLVDVVGNYTVMGFEPVARKYERLGVVKGSVGVRLKGKEERVLILERAEEAKR